MYGYYPEYVSVADKKKQAIKIREKLRKKEDIEPVILEGKTIAKTFWGKAWCTNLESYADYDNRLGRGRSYIRADAVCHLKIEAGKIIAYVNGSSLYKLEIEVNPLPKQRWEKIKSNALGKISNLLDILQGKLPKELIHNICDTHEGIFPSIEELSFNCNCPDYAEMCKHVAAALYGVGHRLDKAPELLFVMRQVEINDLIASDLYLDKLTESQSEQTDLLEVDDLGALFGIELESQPSLTENSDEKNSRNISEKPVKTVKSPKKDNKSTAKATKTTKTSSTAKISKTTKTEKSKKATTK